MLELTIEKKLHHIWVGELPPPTKWLNSWKKKHPDWEYKLWGNDDLYGTEWINQKQIDHYTKTKEWGGVADCMRYEILHKCGGMVVGADWKCINNVDELFTDGNEAYAIDTSKYRDDIPINPKNKGATMPLFACKKGSKVAKKLIQMVGRIKVYRSPASTTGNRLMQKFFNHNKYRNITIFPSHLFIPEHYNGWKYTGKDKVYSVHYWGTTKNTYDKGR